MIINNILGGVAELSEDNKQLTEIWKPIAGYEGVYDISNLGRVKRLNTKNICMSRWGTERYISFKEKIIKLFSAKNGLFKCNSL